MADVKNKQVATAPFAHAVEKRVVEYDFAKDAGAQAVLDLLLISEATVLVGFYAMVETQFESLGAPAVDVGIKGGDTNLLMADVAKATFAPGAVLNQATVGEAYKLAAGAILSMENKTADITAGKVKFVFLLAKFY